MDSKIYKLASDYLNQKLSDEIKDEFVNAAVHFNVNNDIYKKYSSVQIEYMLSIISSDKTIDYIELCSVYGYILYREIENNNLEENDRIEALQVILEISSSISNYLRGLINEDELNEKLLNVINILNLSDEENKNIMKLLN